jgi:hypothetical protein
MESYF